MHPTNCLNCGTLLTADDRFCPTCGQKTDTHKMTMSHIWHDLIHAFTHADKGLLFVWKEMLHRPGHVAREYVDGMRKKYFNPFSFLLIIVAVATLLAASFDLMTGNRRDPISIFLNKHANFVILLNVPIGAFFSWMLFRGSGRTYAENMVLHAYANGERSAFYSLLLVPLMLLLPKQFMTIVYTYHVAWMIYLGWACSQFFQQRNAWGYIRGALVALFTFAIIYLLITTAYVVYYRYIYVPVRR